MSFLSQLVEGVANGLGASKKDVRSKRVRNGPGSGKETGSALSAEALDEVSDLVEGGLRGMATVLVSKLDAQAKRIDEAEQRASTQEQLLQSVISDIAASNRELKSQLSRLEKRTADIESELEETKKQVPSGTPQATGPSSSAAPIDNSNAATPYECRTIARMGNFPWNTPATELVRMAKDSLAKAGVPDAHWRHLHAPRDPGSSVELEFNDACNLQSARLAIRCSAERVGDKFVWLDAAKTRDELRPARLTHRGATALSDLESKRPEDARGNVEKVMTGKQVKVAGDVMGYSAYGQWEWTRAAHGRYDEDSLKVIKAWIEAP